MQSLKSISNSYSNSKLNNFNNSNSYSTADILKLFDTLEDVIPKDGYGGFYVNQYRKLGGIRFMELVAKARAGSDTPQRLFCWMLKNHKVVK